MRLYPYVDWLHNNHTLNGAPALSRAFAEDDTHTLLHFLYAGQYHTARPYIRVTSIPNFDPSALPYWDIYVKEGIADTIRVGGTMAGEFTAGLSGKWAARVMVASE